MKDHRVTVRFPAKLRQRLKAAAQRSGRRESDLVRGAVERQLAVEDHALPAFEHAKKAGLIGAVRGARRDLSTNPDISMDLAALEEPGTGGYRPDRGHPNGIRRTPWSLRRAT